MNKLPIGQYLIKNNLITEEQLDRCVTLTHSEEKYADYKLGDVCVAEGYISIDILGEYLNFPVLDITRLYNYVDGDIFDSLDSSYLLSKKFVPYRKNERGSLSICMVNVQSKNERNEIIQYLLAKKVIDNHRQVEFFLCSMNMIEEVIDLVSRREEIKESNMTAEQKELKLVESLPMEERPRYFYNKIIGRAIQRDASDIHIEPMLETVNIRFRLDGVLTKEPVYTLPKKEYHNPILAIIKTKAELNVAEKRIPQDGSISFEDEESGLTADLRISTLNTVFGEKCVIRILPKSENIKKVTDIGLTDDQMDKLLYLASKPKGLILVTGPTGSGKSTTLYALLQHINDGTRNISTAENPVEMKIEGIFQAQVNKDIDFTFETILRAFLRQDPDVMMVGEIRDLETADIAVKAAETGHLVLSTLHTNSGAATINRLAKMGIPAYLINESLISVVAQRLVRKVCPHCKRKGHTTEKHKLYIEEKMNQSPQKIDKSFIEHEYYVCNPQGCQHCEKGYKGRVAVYEILLFDDTLKDFVSLSKDHIDIIQLTKLAIENGHELMYVDGLRKAKEGVTTLDELIRIVE